MFDQLDDPNPPTFGGDFRRGVRDKVRTRRRRRTALGGAAGVVVLGVGGLAMRAADQLGDVERVDMAGTGRVATGEPVTVLLIGTDGGTTLADGGAAVGAERPALTDTMVLARLDPSGGGLRLLSLPRDLDVSAPGEPVRRLNSVVATDGVDGLIATIEGLGFPIDHVASVDFAGFGALVDAVGGVEVELGAPLRDEMSGLLIESAGCQRLDAAQSLALVRARHLETFDGTNWVSAPSGDVGRTDRQRAFIESAWRQVRTQTPTPFSADRLAGWAQEHLVVDSELDNATLVELIGRAMQLDGMVDGSGQLPTTPETRDGVAVLRATDQLGATVEWFDGAGTAAPGAVPEPTVAASGSDAGSGRPLVSACG